LVLSGASAPTTTTPILVVSQAPVSPTAVLPTEAQLPATGNRSGPLALFGAAMLGVGLTLIGLAKRTRPVSS
jgi:LPXTG-motif cell wall-anchored protein